MDRVMQKYWTLYYGCWHHFQSWEKLQMAANFFSLFRWVQFLCLYFQCIYEYKVDNRLSRPTLYFLFPQRNLELRKRLGPSNYKINHVIRKSMPELTFLPSLNIFELIWLEWQGLLKISKIAVKYTVLGDSCALFLFIL